MLRAGYEAQVKKAFKRLADQNSPLQRDGEKMLIRKTIMMSPSVLTVHIHIHSDQHPFVSQDTKWAGCRA